MTNVFTRLSKILTDPQREKLREYVQKLKAERGAGRRRAAQVFVVDPDGRPRAVKLFIGITNDSETEVKPGSPKGGGQRYRRFSRFVRIRQRRIHQPAAADPGRQEKLTDGHADYPDKSS